MNLGQSVIESNIEWIIFWQNSNIELNQIGYRTPLPTGDKEGAKAYLRYHFLNYELKQLPGKFHPFWEKKSESWSFYSFSNFCVLEVPNTSFVFQVTEVTETETTSLSASKVIIRSVTIYSVVSSFLCVIFVVYLFPVFLLSEA